MSIDLQNKISEVSQLLKPFEPGIRKAFNDRYGEGQDDVFHQDIESLSGYLAVRHRKQIDGLSHALRKNSEGFGTMQRALGDILSRKVLHDETEEQRVRSFSERLRWLINGDNLLRTAYVSDDGAYERRWDELLLEVHENSAELADIMERSETLVETSQAAALKEIFGNGGIAPAFNQNRPSAESIEHEIVRSETGQMNNLGAVFAGNYSYIESYGCEGDELKEVTDDIAGALRRFPEPFSYILHGYVGIEAVNNALLLTTEKDGQAFEHMDQIPMVAPAGGFALRKIIRRTFARSVESALAMTGERLPRLSMNWEEGARRFIVTDRDKRGLFRAFDPGTQDRADMEGWARGLGQNGGIAFLKSAVEITVPKLRIAPIMPSPMGGAGMGPLTMPLKF